MELEDPDLLQNRPALQRAVVISAGVIANILLSVALAAYTAGSTGLTHPIFAPGVQVTSEPTVGTPAQAVRESADILFIIPTAHTHTHTHIYIYI